MADDEKVRAQLIEQLKKARAKAEKIEKAMKALQTMEPKVRLSNLVKAYMDAIKVSDGLTSVRPATLKAVQTTEKNCNSATIKAAVSGIQGHIKDVTKDFGKDKTKKKEFDKFIKAMTEISTKLAKNA